MGADAFTSSGHFNDIVATQYPPLGGALTANPRVMFRAPNNRPLSEPLGSHDDDDDKQIHVLRVNGDRWVVASCTEGLVTVSLAFRV